MTETSSTENEPTAVPVTETTGATSVEQKKPLWLRLFGHDLSAPLLLLALALVFFVPGQWTVPPLDRDEPRYTQATKQMMETGDYVDIRFQDQARHKKPVGIYWMQVAAAKVIGDGPDSPLWVYRLPSLIGAVLVVLAGFWMARAFMGAPGALLVGLFLVSAIILGVEGRLAKTDAMLFASIVIAQGALARIWLSEKDKRLWGLGFVFWTALAIGIMVKGPVAPMVVGFTVAGLMLLSRKVRWFQAASPIIGFLWMIALASPWYIAIGLATDGAFFTEAIGKDLVGKIGQGQESHGAPPLTHLGAMLGVFWPLPAFFVLALPVIWRERKSPLVLFAAAWFLPSWIVFELVATKLPHYTMPLLPALALATAAALVDGAGTQSARWHRWVSAILLAVPAIAVAGASFGGPIALGVWPSPPGVVIAVLGAILSLIAASRIVAAVPLKAMSVAIGAAACISVGVWGFVGPALTPIWVSPRLASAIDAVPGCTTKAVTTTGFHEPSFIFLQGTDTKIVPAEEAASLLSENDNSGDGHCRIAAIESREKTAFLEAAKAKALVPELVGEVDGLNINGGDDVVIGLYRAKQPTNEE
ncbi:glycosyl transferase family protein [Roseibium sp. TrichSKD4]|uniref:ArnT family glycosyltransferase n=1 Tax=Roseibium sp. TrichSKD4 TaxID=744980 RepID=UPI0001E5631C|nr:glycosyltransferase family 39 protein [Roseibium sp. TrichSKD4]EFO33868.1 glycosyl transferase family protein [Roseibium sp. TrichSKD4]